MTRFRQLLIFSFLLQLITGFASGSKASAVKDEKISSPPQRSCSYFQFLWGAHAEYSQHFDEALEAFEKALDCDPAATYIEKKLPVLLFRQGKVEQAATLLRAGIDKDPDDIDQYLLLAHLAIQQNNRDEAIELYEEVLLRDPVNEGVRLRLGILSVQQERLEDAETIFRALLIDNPELSLAQIYLARLLQMKGDTLTAIKMYEEVLSQNWSADLAYEMIDFYLPLEKHTDMLRLYNSLLNRDPTSERALIGRIQTLLSMGNDDEALIELRNLRETNGNMDRLDMAISKTLLRLGKVNEAITILEGLKNGETAAEANYLLALIAFQDEELNKSLNYIHAILPDSAEYPDAIYLQVRILRSQNKHDKALILLRDVTSDVDKLHPLFYALLSSIYQEQGRIEEAMETLVKGTESFPRNEQLHFEHALLLERSGLQEQAITAMERVLEITPEHAEALNYIGYTWADRNIHLDKAYDYIHRAVRLKPDNGYIRDSLGWVEYRLGNFDTALAELLHALTLEPGDPNIYEHLGDVYKALNRPADAQKSYQKALEMIDDKKTQRAIQKKIDEF